MSQKKANILILYHPTNDQIFQVVNSTLGLLETFPEVKQIETIGIDSDLQKVKQKVEDSNILVTLVSALFLGSFTAIQDWFFERRANKKLYVFPVLVDECLYDETDFKKVIQIGELPFQKDDKIDQSRLMKHVRTLFTDLKDILNQLSSFQISNDIFQKSLLKLNYSLQKKELRSFRRATQNRYHPINVFLLPGTVQCCHDLLVQYFVQRFGKGKVEYEKFPIAQHATGFKEELIWIIIRDALNISEGYDAKFIFQQILEKLKFNHIVLQMDDFGRDKNTYIKVINKFWQEFKVYVDKTGSSPKHNFFLFINDRLCHQNTYNKEDFLPNEQASQFQPFVQIFSPIKEVNQDDLSEWIEELRDDSDDRMISLADHCLIPK